MYVEDILSTQYRHLYRTSNKAPEGSGEFFAVKRNVMAWFNKCIYIAIRGISKRLYMYITALHQLEDSVSTVILETK